MSYATTYSPRVRVLIKDLETAQVLYDISDDLTSISTNKAYGRCSGTWQLMLAYREYSLVPSQMVTIEKDAGDGAGYLPVMCGMVDRVSRVKQGGPVPQRAVKVSGRDMGKLLETHDVAFDIIAYNRQIATQEPGKVQSVTAMSRTFNPQITMGTPAEIINSAFEICLHDMLKTTKRIAFVSDCNDSSKIHQPQLATTQGTSFWQFIKGVEHHPFNVLTTDTTLGDVNAFKVVLEKFPFNGETGRLERPVDQWHTIGETEIITEDLGAGDQERINFTSYQPLIFPQAKIMEYDVMMAHPDLSRLDDGSVRQYGLSVQVFRDPFTPPELEGIHDADQGRKLAALNTAKGMASTLWNWYRNNHTYESGTVTVHLRPDIRVGSGLLIRQPDGTYKEYLIEQVAHQCIFHPQPSFQTTLHLTRGQKAAPGNAEKAKP